MRRAPARLQVRRALNLLPDALRPDTSSRRRWEIWAPIALVVAAALVATALPLWQKRGYAIALMQQASQGRAQADASSALREQLERLTGDYNFALSKKYAYPSALQSVEDVTKILPDDTWLTQLEMKSSTKGKETKRELMVRGESANAGRLVSLFEESKLFGETAPRSPTTKIQPGPGEIFDLGAQLKPLPPPPLAAGGDRRGHGVGAARDAALRPARACACRGQGRRAREGRILGGVRCGDTGESAPRRTAGRRLPPRRLAAPAGAGPRARRRLPSAPALRLAAPPACHASGGRLARSGQPPATARRAARKGDAMIAAITRLPPPRQRLLAVALFVVAVLLALSVLLVPVLLLHKHYDDTIVELTDRVDRYRRVAAQAPEYRKALDAMRDKDGRRFFLKNTAPNLAGAELQEQVRNAIESNGGRITTSQNQGPKDDGRFRQITVTVQFFASTPALQKILYALESQPPYLSVENMTLRPLNAFRGFKPATGQEPEINVQLDVAAFAFAEPERK